MLFRRSVLVWIQSPLHQCQMLNLNLQKRSLCFKYTCGIWHIVSLLFFDSKIYKCTPLFPVLFPEKENPQQESNNIQCNIQLLSASEIKYVYISVFIIEKIINNQNVFVCFFKIWMHYLSQQHDNIAGGNVCYTMCATLIKTELSPMKKKMKKRKTL